jgi:hypothetical protein
VVTSKKSSATLAGRGTVRRKPHEPVPIYYTIHMNPSNGQATFVEFETNPPASDGELLYLTLEDGRVLQCQVLDESPFCAVIGNGPVVERRKRIRESADHLSQDADQPN